MALGAVAIGFVALSGGHGSDPRTPAGLPGLSPPFLGVAVIGSGGPTAAVDAYGNVVDLRALGPAGPARIAVSAKRQAAGTVAASEAIIARPRLPDGRALPFWRADSVRQRYLAGSNALRTVARFGDRKAVVVRRIGGRAAIQADRRWLGRARPLGSAAPHWARAMYRRSLLVLRALTDRRSGAVAAGARDGWAYVWPRDAAAVALAFASAGYRPEARRVARFLLRLDLSAAARFRGTGAPVPGRARQGDAAGWVTAAARAAELKPNHTDGAQWRWRDLPDYQEGEPGDYLGNAIASVPLTAGSRTSPYGRGSPQRQSGERIASEFETAAHGLGREAGDPSGDLDSSAAWAVRPFPIAALYPTVGRTLLRLVATRGTRFGIVPSENWPGGDDPWTAPTAWTAWALAVLAWEDRGPGRARVERRAAMGLIVDLRRAATPLGLLPERVNARTGVPTSTTPLAWSHAFAILTLRQLWPGRAGA